MVVISTMCFGLCIYYSFVNIDFYGSLFNIVREKVLAAIQHRRGPNKVGVLVYCNL